MGWPRSCGLSRGEGAGAGAEKTLGVAGLSLKGQRYKNLRIADRMSKDPTQQKAKAGLGHVAVAGAALGLAMWSMIHPPRALGQVGTSSEYRQKAIVLANLPKFVEWPAEAFAGTDVPLQVCVYGPFSFGTTLAEAVRGEIAHGRRMEVRLAKQEDELRSCHVLFLSGLDRARAARALDVVRGGTTLTVGESEGFLKLGGMVNLTSENGRTYFDVSLESAAQGPLKISSKLLVLARHVVRPQGPEKPGPVA